MIVITTAITPSLNASMRPRVTWTSSQSGPCGHEDPWDSNRWWWGSSRRPTTHPSSVHERELMRVRVALDLESEVRGRDVGSAEVDPRPDACLDHLLDHVR